MYTEKYGAQELAFTLDTPSSMLIQEARKQSSNLSMKGEKADASRILEDAKSKASLLWCAQQGLPLLGNLEWSYWVHWLPRGFRQNIVRYTGYSTTDKWPYCENWNRFSKHWSIPTDVNEIISGTSSIFSALEIRAHPGDYQEQKREYALFGYMYHSDGNIQGVLLARWSSKPLLSVEDVMKIAAAEYVALFATIDFYGDTGDFLSGWFYTKLMLKSFALTPFLRFKRFLRTAFLKWERPDLDPYL